VSWPRRLPQVGHLGAGVVMHRSMVRAEVPVHHKYRRGPSQQHHAHSKVSASPTIDASDFHGVGRVPMGRALAEKAVRRYGRIFFISVLFGGRPRAPSLLRQTNQLLASLTVT
jgi:hypothetical protein